MDDRSDDNDGHESGDSVGDWSDDSVGLESEDSDDPRLKLAKMMVTHQVDEDRVAAIEDARAAKLYRNRSCTELEAEAEEKAFVDAHGEDAFRDARRTTNMFVDDEAESGDDVGDETDVHGRLPIDECAGPVQERTEGAAYLDDLARYYEEIIKQGKSKFERRVGDGDWPENWKSTRPGYYEENDATTEESAANQRHAKYVDLERLATSFQTHRCNACCFKTGTKHCRFHYPKPIIVATGFKDGVLYGKRLESRCNNHNETILSVLRSNHDVKLLTTGVDSKATIFYITDYVTKSELSHIQSVTLLKVAIDKLDENKYDRPTPQVDGFNEAENKARQRLFTILQVMDTDVERSGQWCTLVLLGMPLEYKSHTFRSFNTRSFILHCQQAHANEVTVVDDFEESATPIINIDDPDAAVEFTNAFCDYDLRSSVETIRLYPRTSATHLYSPFEETITNSSFEVEVAQLSPYEYTSRVTKLKMNDPTAKKRPANHVRYHPTHPQHDTHVQILRDVSNPRIPSPIPVLLGFSIPLREEDPERYGLSLLSLLTPYDSSCNLKEANQTWIDAFDKYMRQIEIVDPHRWARTMEIIENMNSITSGRGQQLVERVERERLKQAQGLAKPSDIDGPNDFGGVADDDFNNAPDSMNGQMLSEFVYESLPEDGPLAGLPNKLNDSVMDLYSEVHPSVDKVCESLMNKAGPTGPSNESESNANDERLKGLARDYTAILQAAKDATHNTPVRETITVPPDWVRSIISTEGLDDKQRAAFLTIAMHIIQMELWEINQALPTFGEAMEKPEQMIFYLGGEGGTGKSKVLLAFTNFLLKLKLRHALRIAAVTGVAAGHVGGSTIDSLFGFGPQDKDNTVTPANDRLRKKFASASILFIDEVSMIGCKEVHKISQRLMEIKGNKEKFGGLTVILAGDFYQLQPIGSTPLFQSPLANRDENLTKASQGYLTFQQVTHAIFLEKQYRMAGDPVYKSFVSRYRHGEQRPKEDEKYLRERLLTPNNTLQTGHLKDCPEDPVIIVDGNGLRYRINLKKATALAKATKQKLLFSVAIDKCGTHVLTNPIRYELLTMGDGCNSGYGAGLLPLVLGMPVMLKNNIGTELCLANGTIGVVIQIDVDYREVVDYNDLATPHYLRYQPTVYVHFKEAESLFHLEGLPKGVLPMNKNFGYQSRKMSFLFRKKMKGVDVRATITRKQLWILPAFAITVNSSQGRSLHSAIIDLSEQKQDRAERAYVKLSRLMRGKFLAIQGTWSRLMWKAKPNEAMIQYVQQKLLSKEKNTLANVPTPRNVMKALAKRNTSINNNRRNNGGRVAVPVK